MANNFFKIKKRLNQWGVNRLVQQSLESVVEINKTAFSEGKPFVDACWQIIFSIDNAERIMRGMGILEDAVDYEKELSAFKQETNKTNFEANDSMNNAVRAVKIAQFKFQLMVEAMKNYEPSEFTLEL